MSRRGGAANRPPYIELLNGRVNGYSEVKLVLFLWSIMEKRCDQRTVLAQDHGTVPALF